MKDWTRFAVCYWHTFRGLGADPFGGQTIFRAWDDGSNRWGAGAVGVAFVRES